MKHKLLSVILMVILLLCLKGSEIMEKERPKRLQIVDRMQPKWFWVTGARRVGVCAGSKILI